MYRYTILGLVVGILLATILLANYFVLLPSEEISIDDVVLQNFTLDSHSEEKQSGISKQEQSETMSDQAQTKATIEELIKNNKVMVFSKSYCPYSRKAKAALATLLSPEQMTVLEIETRPDMLTIQDLMMDITGGRSVPRVFIDGEFIGGGDETAELVQSGQLKQKLVAAGVL